MNFCISVKIHNMKYIGYNINVLKILTFYEYIAIQVQLLILLVSLKQSFSTRHSMSLTDQNTRDHPAWTIGNDRTGISCTAARSVYPQYINYT